MGINRGHKTILWENVHDAIIKQIHALSDVLESHDDYLVVLRDSNKINDGSILRYQVWCLTPKIQPLVNTI